MSDGKKKLSFLTVISTIICVVFVCEAAAPAAAIGNQQFFWWIFLILTFLLPYGMVVAELGTTYDGEGAFTTGYAMAWATSGAPAFRTTTGLTTRCGLPRWLLCSRTFWAWSLASSSI